MVNLAAQGYSSAGKGTGRGGLCVRVPVPPPLALTDRVIAFMIGAFSKRADNVARRRCNAGCRLRQALPGEGKSSFQERQMAVPRETLIPRLPMLRVLGVSKGESRTCRKRHPCLGASQGLSLLRWSREGLNPMSVKTDGVRPNPKARIALLPSVGFLMYKRDAAGPRGMCWLRNLSMCKSHARSLTSLRLPLATTRHRTPR